MKKSKDTYRKEKMVLQTEIDENLKGINEMCDF